MFGIPLMCWEFSDVSLLSRFQPNLLVTVSLSSSLMGSNKALYIHPRALDISVKDTNMMHAPSPNFCMVSYIDVAEAYKEVL